MSFLNMNGLQQMMLKADVTKISDSGTIFYLGFCKKGTTGTDAASWAICRVTQTGTDPDFTYITEWANGQNDPETQNLVFDLYATFGYSLRKF